MVLQSLWASLVLFITRHRMREIAPYATAVLLGFSAFFGGLAVFAANPFDTLAVAPAQGTGLDPLLMHPSMMMHPPMLYSGYTLMSIPFAFAIGALITGSSARSGSATRDGSRSRRGCSWEPASFSGPAGPTRSSGGAAIGDGMRLRTQR